MEKCVNCQFYDRRNARPSDGRATMWGQCRRHSPLLNPLNVKQYAVEGVWPLVRDDDWCGEWRSPARIAMARPRSVARGSDGANIVAIAQDAPRIPQPPATAGSHGSSQVAGDD